MKLAYIIISHKNPLQIERLVLSLMVNDDDIFVIHYDKNSDDASYIKLVAVFAPYDNVMFSDRHCCSWGSFGMVEATISCMKMLYSKKRCFDYALLLSGQDYLLKNVGNLKEYLALTQGSSFIKFFKLPDASWQGGGLNRIQLWHYRRLDVLGYSLKHPQCLQLFNNIMNKIITNRNFPLGYEPFGGSSWWCLTNESIRYILEFILHNVKFIRYFQSVHCPDEIFFQSILLNSPLCSTMRNESLTFDDWVTGPEYPRILCVDDFERIVRQPFFFARKFDMFKDSQILEMLDEHIGANRC